MKKVTNKIITLLTALVMVLGMAITPAFADETGAGAQTGDGIYRIDTDPFGIAGNKIVKSTENNRLYGYNAKMSWTGFGSGTTASPAFIFFNTTSSNEKIKVKDDNGYKYNYINAWVYNPEVKYSTNEDNTKGKTSELVWLLRTGASADATTGDTSYQRARVSMNWTGWKLVSLPISQFTKGSQPSSLDYGIYKIDFSVNGWAGSVPSWPDGNHYAYVDAMWFSAETVTAAESFTHDGYISADLGGDNAFTFNTSSQTYASSLADKVTVKKDGAVLTNGYTAEADSKKLNIRFDGNLESGSKYEIDLGNSVLKTVFKVDDAFSGEGKYRIDTDPFSISNNKVVKSMENSRLSDHTAKMSWTGFGETGANAGSMFFLASTDNERLKITDKYNYINVWLYNPEVKQSTLENKIKGRTSQIILLLRTGQNATDRSEVYCFRYGISMDWTGWKLVSVPISGFTNNRAGSASLDYGIYKIDISTNGWETSVPSWPSGNHYAYVDAMWFSKDAPTAAELTVTETNYDADGDGYVSADLGGDNTFVFETSSQVSKARAYGAVTVKKDGEILTDGYTIDTASDKLNIKFDEKLKYGSTYELTLGTNLCDLYGNCINAAKTVTLNVEPEFIISDVNVNYNGGKASATAKIKINDGTDRNFVLIVTSKNGDELKEMAATAKTTVTAADGEITLNTDEISAAEGDKLTVMLWDGLDTLKPYIGKVSR